MRYCLFHQRFLFIVTVLECESLFIYSAVFAAQGVSLCEYFRADTGFPAKFAMLSRVSDQKDERAKHGHVTWRVPFDHPTMILNRCRFISCLELHLQSVSRGVSIPEESSTTYDCPSESAQPSEST